MQYRTSKRGAKRRGIDFALTLAEYQTLQRSSGSVCALCHRPWSCRLHVVPTVDRIDPEQGYTVLNCRVICADCNSKKGSLEEKRPPMEEVRVRMDAWIRLKENHYGTK